MAAVGALAGVHGRQERVGALVGRLPDDGGDLVRNGHHVGEVDAETSDGGDGDAASVGAVPPVDRGSAVPRAGWRLAFARDNDIDKGGAVGRDLVELSSGRLTRISR